MNIIQVKGIWVLYARYYKIYREQFQSIMEGADYLKHLSDIGKCFAIAIIRDGSIEWKDEDFSDNKVIEDFNKSEIIT